MEFKILLLISFLVSTQGHSLAKVAPTQDFGPQVKVVLDELLTAMAENPVVIPDFPNIRVQLEEFIKELIGQDKESPVKGMLEISGPAIGLKPGGVCDHAVVNLNSLVQPLNLDLALSLPGVGILTNYSIDALILDNIPLVGAGHLFFGLDLSVGVIGDLKFKLGSNPGKFTTFDYTLDLRSIELNLDGLTGDESLNELALTVINDFIKNTFTQPLVDLEAELHVPILRGVIHDTLDEFVAPVTYQMLWDLLNPKP